MRKHTCDLVTDEDATHALIISLVKLDPSGSYETGAEPEHLIILDAGKSVAERVRADDLHGLGQLVPRSRRPKTAEPKPRQARRGANPAAMTAASSLIGGE